MWDYFVAQQTLKLRVGQLGMRVAGHLAALATVLVQSGH